MSNPDFARETRSFKTNTCLTEPSLAEYNELGRNYTYDPRIQRTCPKVKRKCSACSNLFPIDPARKYGYDACSNCSNVPSVTPEIYPVRRIDRADFDNKCQGFCSYPKDTFAYEMPPDYCLRSCGNYPEYNPYFPGHFRKKWRIDPATGDVTYLPIDEVLCDNRYNWQYNNRYIDAVSDPIIYDQNNFRDQIVKASLDGRVDVSGSSAQAARALATKASVLAPTNVLPPISVEEYVYGPSEVSPGDQDNYAHKFVRENRYNAQKLKKNIYIRPNTDDSEPYTTSLYQTPYDTTKNLISTGKLVNTYSGEVYETFENQLPPPDTNRNVMLKTQFEKINPRLLHLTGGYNWHNPPPRRKEQSGEVFHPVSARGGASAFGSNLYDAQVTQQLKQFASRDIYNNQDGNQVVEPSMYGDKPQGYFGLVPRVRYSPFLPATQELDLKGRVQAPEALNPDLRKREQYTGEFFARKANLLVDRAINPNTLLNGVEAVSQIPIASDHVGKFGQCRTYIQPAFIDGAPYVLHEEYRDGKTMSGSTTRAGPIDFGNNEPTQQPIDTSFRAKLNPEQSNPISSGPSFQAGDLITSETTNRPSGKFLAEYKLPTASASIPTTGETLVSQQNIRASGKIGIVDESFGNAGLSNEQFQNQLSLPQLQTLRSTLKSHDYLFPTSALTPTPTAGIIVSDQTIRDTLKIPAAESAFRIGDPSKDGVGGVLVSQASIRDSAKTSIADQPFRIGEPSIPSAGDILMSEADVRDTLKIATEDAFRSGPTDVILPQGYVLIDKDLPCTQRMTTLVSSHHAGPDGKMFGDQLPLQLLTSKQYRGKSIQPYITQNKRVYDGIGGNSTRIIPEYRQLRRRNDTYLYPNPDQSLIKPSNAKIIPSMRLTQRALVEAHDLALTGDSC